jgi:5-methylthioribose kinase
VAEEWYVDRARGGREADALAALDGAVGPLGVPRLRFVDRHRMLLGMDLVPAPARPWKVDLLAGRIDLTVVTAVAAGMAALHRRPVPDSLAGAAGRDLFHALRTEPYYRTTAARAPHLAPALDRLIGAGVDPAPTTLIHGDLNPKNVLVTTDSPVLLDWEIAHAGDPAFDLGMMTAHLLLKACRPGPWTGTDDLLTAAGMLWRSYDGPAVEQRALRHAGAIMAARLHGKSPVDYLLTAASKAAVMAVAEFALGAGDPSIEGVLGFVADCLQPWPRRPNEKLTSASTSASVTAGESPAPATI